LGHEIFYRHIDEQPGYGRLGRHVLHDSRSLAYMVAEWPNHAIQSVVWKRATSILDQGNLGSCTGNAAVGTLGTDPFVQTIVGGPQLDETEALALYSSATNLDAYPGAYPPDDTGSDGLSVAKAAHKAGLISGYQHALTLTAALTALQSRPVITGVNWYDSFDAPDLYGHVSISPGASVRGGHEFEVLGVDVDAKTVRAANSWGPTWGDHGYFSFSFDTWTRLLAEQGDVTVFTPLSEPAPTPTPPSPRPPVWPTNPTDHVSTQEFIAVARKFIADHPAS
jgi:hypothetical protein